MIFPTSLFLSNLFQSFSPLFFLWIGLVWPIWTNRGQIEQCIVSCGRSVLVPNCIFSFVLFLDLFLFLWLVYILQTEAGHPASNFERASRPLLISHQYWWQNVLLWPFHSSFSSKSSWPDSAQCWSYLEFVVIAIDFANTIHYSSRI